MKNQLLFTFLLLFSLSHSALSQCLAPAHCETVDLDFQTNGNGVNISHLTDWTYSHGSPSVTNNGFWLWSYNYRGEGINYSGYNFVAGQEYTICFVASTTTSNGADASSNAKFRIVGTNNAIGGYNSAVSDNPIPSNPISSQMIVNELWSTFPSPSNGVSTATYSYTFIADDNWNNLWFYPINPSLPQVEIEISSLIICPTVPCDASFTTWLNDQDDGTTGISVILHNSNNTITNMTILEDNIEVYSGSHVSYIGSSGKSYTICLTVVNNSTHQECTKCYSFCLEQKFKSEVKRDSGNTNSRIPEKYKDSPLDEELRISISPNPSNRLFEVSTSSTEIKMTSVKVFDLNSREVYTGVLTDNQNSSSIDLKDQPVGVYVVKIQYSDGSVSQEKIVLKE